MKLGARYHSGGWYAPPGVHLSAFDCQCGAVAFKRAGDPNVGEFSNAVVLNKFGDVPEDLSAL